MSFSCETEIHYGGLIGYPYCYNKTGIDGKICYKTSNCEKKGACVTDEIGKLPGKCSTEPYGCPIYVLENGTTEDFQLCTD